MRTSRPSVDAATSPRGTGSGAPCFHSRPAEPPSTRHASRIESRAIMRAEGFEPSRSFEHRPLKPACLPVPPRPRFRKDRSEYHHRMSNPAEQERESEQSDKKKNKELGEEENAPGRGTAAGGGGGW